MPLSLTDLALRKPMPIIRLLTIFALITALSACLKAHRIDIQQGNLLTDKEVSQLQPGMTQREVRYILGTPLIVDPFHQDRWDYYYSLNLGREQVAKRRITIVFVNDQLDHVEGDVTANTEKAGDDEPSGTVIAEPQREKAGFFEKAWSKIKVWDKDQPN